MSDTHQSRWDALTEIARRCVADKQFDKAEEAFLAALREAEQFGDGDSRVAATLNALARVYHRRSKFFPAAALLHRLLAIKEREHGEKHPELAGILSNLAEMYARLGDTRQELELRSRALDIRTASGESEGGALEGLRDRIAELREKLSEETSRTEAARTSPRQRMRVPTGATDLPLILPTPVATAAQRAPFAPAMSPLREAPPWTAPGSDAERGAPRAQPWATRTPTPAPAPKVAPPTPVATLAPVIEDRAAAVTPAVVLVPAIEPLGASVTPAQPMVAAPLPLAAGPAWKPLAPPAPKASWPGERAEAEPDRQPEPDEYIQDAPYRPRRNWRPIATGAVAVALAAVLAVMVVSRPETSASSTGQVEAPSTTPEPPPPPRSSVGPIDRTVKEAMEIGLANLENASGSTQFSVEQPVEPPVTPNAELPIEGGTEPGSITRSTAPSDPRLRVALPSASLARVSDSIESAITAKVDSLTLVNDQTVIEYKGKKPRQ